MLKFRISLANEPGETYEVDGFEAVLGRAPTCDVVVAQKHITVSGKHARVMAGIVVLDLGSANGTFVSARNIAEGNQVTRGQVAGAEVAPGGQFKIGNSVHVSVESDFGGAQAPASFSGSTSGSTSGAPPTGFPDGATVQGSGGQTDERIAELDRALSDERERNEALNRKMQEALAKASDISEETILTHPLVQQIIDEREDLRRRLDSSTQEVKSLQSGASDGVAVQNLQNDAEGARKRSEELQTEVTELRQRVDQLLSENQRLASSQGSTDMGDTPTNVHGAATPAAPGPPAALQGEVERLTAENARLIQEVAAAQVNTGSPSEVFKKLNAEIQRLSGDLSAANAKLASQPAQGSGSPAGSPADSTSGPPAGSPTKTGTTNPVMVGGGLAVLKKLADADIDSVPQDLERPVDQFFYAEMFRFARTSEKLLTDVVCKAIGLMGGNTMMPGHDHTLRPLTAAIIDNPSEYGPRAEFASYVKELQRWMLIGTQIFPEAATKYAVELRDSISESALTAGNPIPKMLMMRGGSDGELWRRAQGLLSEQSGEVIRDRIHSLARDSADRMSHGR